MEWNKVISFRKGQETSLWLIKILLRSMATVHNFTFINAITTGFSSFLFDIILFIFVILSYPFILLCLNLLLITIVWEMEESDKSIL